ncbi:MAG TPA: DegQ family serine endoprotease [Bryobacteraceae bacterium]
MNRQNFRRRSQAILVTAALAIGVGVAGLAAADHMGKANPPAVLNVAEGTVSSPNRLGFAPVVKKVLPTVVNIASTKVTKVPTGMSDNGDWFFQQFFGDQGSGRRQFRNPQQQAPEQQREQGLGSGVIMTQNGYILTNNHVVDGATDVRVTLNDKREFKATVVGRDPHSDLAVLKIDATNLPAITVSDSSQVEVGDYALAVGDPFGVGQTVTMGIVSATGRNHLGIEDYEDFIQTDAPINPGNSGGALVNDRGQLIGINTAILTHSSGNQGIGFAIPVNMARNVMDQLVKNGKVTRAYLGILPQDITPSIAKAFGVSQTGGALVGDVTANSPAMRAGLQKGDIILELNGKPVVDSNSLRMAISMSPPESNVNLKILRNGSQKDMTVKLTEFPNEQAQATQPGAESGSALSGVSVENLDTDSAHQLGLPANTQGVVVTSVSPASEAAGAGLHRGDVIQEVNRKPVKSTSDFERAVGTSKDETLLLINRNGTTMYLAV